MPDPPQPLDIAVSTEKDLWLAKEEATRLRGLIAKKDAHIKNLARTALASPMKVEDTIAESYRKARRALEDEQAHYKVEKAKDCYYQMRGSFHDAIKDVRQLAIEISDAATGYR